MAGPSDLNVNQPFDIKGVTPSPVGKSVKEKTTELRKHTATVKSEALSSISRTIKDLESTKQIQAGDIITSPSFFGRFKPIHKKSLQQLCAELLSLKNDLEATDSNRDLKKIDDLYNEIDKRLAEINTKWIHSWKEYSKDSQIQSKISTISKSAIAELRSSRASCEHMIEYEEAGLASMPHQENLGRGMRFYYTKEQQKERTLRGNKIKQFTSQAKKISKLIKRAETLQSALDKSASQKDFESLEKVDKELSEIRTIQELITNPKQSASTPVILQLLATMQQQERANWPSIYQTHVDAALSEINRFREKYPESYYTKKEGQTDRDFELAIRRAPVDKVPTLEEATRFANAVVALKQLQTELTSVATDYVQANGSLAECGIVINTINTELGTLRNESRESLGHEAIKTLSNEFARLQAKKSKIENDIRNAKTPSDFKNINKLCSQLKEDLTKLKDSVNELKELRRRAKEDPNQDPMQQYASAVAEAKENKGIGTTEPVRKAAAQMYSILTREKKAIDKAAKNNFNAYVAKLSTFSFVLSDEQLPTWKSAEEAYYAALEHQLGQLPNDKEHDNQNPPNLSDYEAAISYTSWEQGRRNIIKQNNIEKERLLNNLYLTLDNAKDKETAMEAWRTYTSNLQQLAASFQSATV